MTPKQRRELEKMGDEMDPRFKRAWGNLIKMTVSLGWKEIFYLILKFQDEIEKDSPYKFKSNV